MVSGEKRNIEEEIALEKITNILLDIEGTTTSISFVKDTLYPYIRDNLKSYVDEHWNDEEFQADLKELKLQAKKDEEDKIENFCPIEEGEKEKESLIKNVLWQMDLDRKTTALKQLQGHICTEGYENGQLKGHVYDEVAQIFKKWSEEGRKLYIFSSGSVEAQKLLFKNSESGDLSGFLSGYFDTKIGPKTEASSYANIVKAVGCEAGQLLFLTDVVKEAVAADKAGLQVMIVIREGNLPLSDDEKKAFSTISSLKDIVFESSNKKKKICEEENEKTENAEKMEESNEIKNGETEKMETEDTLPKTEDCIEDNKTEEKDQTKTSTDTAMETTETESDNIDVDVDDSTVENSTSEKTVTSSIEDSENVTQTVSEQSKIPEEANLEKEEIADSTNENPAPAKDDERETVEETAEEEKAIEEKTDPEEKNVNGHENGEAKENSENEAKEETNGESNGKVEEEIEAMPVKKVNPDEQADSTVEVTA